MTSHATTTVVHLLGVRGSTPTSGADFLGLGGSTSCLAVAPLDGADRWLVLDAGTGFRHLGTVLGAQPLRADVVLTHLHWDHVQGLPFLSNADREDALIELWIPAREGDDDATALERLARGFSPPHFPIRPDELRGDWRFHALHPGERELTGRIVRVAEIAHKGGVTLGVRVQDGARSFAYLPDHAVSTASPDELARADALAEGVDVLFHGGPYLASEQAIATDFGHSTVHDAVDLALRARAGRLVLVHHAPHRTDDQIQVVLDEAESHVARRGAELLVEVGTEGAAIRI